MLRTRIADVARVAGVSTTTVSHALSGRRPVSAETLAKVDAAVRQLDYRANVMARALRTQRTQTVALVVPDITNPFYPMVARGVQDTLAPSGYQVVVCSTDADSVRERAFLGDMLARSVDGLIIDLFRTDPADLAELVSPDVPVVMFGPMVAEGLGDRVIGDDRVSTAEATRHLIDTGRRRIAFLGAAAGVGPSDQRRAGYEDALLGAGIALDPTLVVEADYTRVGAAVAVGELLRTGVELDGLVSANDVGAIGAIDALNAAGLRVPEDVAVTGFDDIEAASLVRPALTTVDNRAYDKGVVCAQLLLQRMAGELDGPYREIVVPGRFRIRESA